MEKKKDCIYCKYCKKVFLPYGPDDYRKDWICDLDKREYELGEICEKYEEKHYDK